MRPMRATAARRAPRRHRGLPAARRGPAGAGRRRPALPAGEIGGIQVKGPNVFKGYWRMPEKTAEEFTADGWFKTGDVGKVDERGYVTIVGRSKDLIISGGYNVYPAEIEGYINELPGVAESALVGVPHPDFGEVGVAVVIAKPGATLEPEAIIAALKAKLANFKIPKRCFVVPELPRNTMGKVQKNLLREQYSSRRLMPLRPCEAMTIRSHLCFLAAAITASATRSDLATTAFTLTPRACPRVLTPSTSAWAASAHCFSIWRTSLGSTGMPPSK
jgi:hypothetical protein